jgi:hypothetical protein
MGLASGYDFEKVRVFLTSLAEISFNGVVILITDGALVIPQPFLDKLDIWIVNTKNYKRGLAKRAISKTLMFPIFRSIVREVLKITCKYSMEEFLELFEKIYTPQLARYATYYRILKNHSFRNVLLTDVRDVVFQRDPFDNYQDHLSVFHESSKIKDDVDYNANWIRIAFGKTELEKIGNNNICCSGTIMGSYEGIMELEDKILRTSVARKVPHHGIVGIDQGVFNYIIYNDIVKNVTHYGPGQKVLTFAPRMLSRMTVEDGLIKIDAAIPCLVHQYDRNSELLQEVCKRYANF